MQYTVTVLPGDGIGPDIIREAVQVVERVGRKFGHHFTFEERLIGGVAYDQTGEPLPQSTLNSALHSEAVLLGAVGGPKWDGLKGEERPEAALLGIRKALNLFANIRPAKIYRSLRDACPLRPDIIGEDGLDIVVIRELTGGIYFGPRKREIRDGVEMAYDTMLYNENEIRRIAHVAFQSARKRNHLVTNVDKANVLEVSRLWRKVVMEVAKEYPDVTLNHLYVDNAAMQLVRDPKQFDVIVTGNCFGDILSDEASQITGSIGMLPSASMGEGALGMFEPIHGSAPDIAGQDKANPIATILSAAMMFTYSFGKLEEAACIEKAVDEVLEAGYRTADIWSEGCTLVGTRQMGQLICERIEAI